jgi:hypothetical protein
VLPPLAPLNFSLENVTSDSFAATVAYFSDIEFAAQLCLEICASQTVEDAVAAQLKQTHDVLRRALLLQPQPGARALLLSALNMAGPGANPALTARAAAQLDRQSAWPRHEHFFRFDKSLLRLTRNAMSKKWVRRHFVLKGRRLYHSNGKNGFPDSLVGTMAFIRSNPEPDGHYCLDLRGAHAYSSLLF